MIKLGFHEQWVNLTMNCVSYVKYTIRYNSQETESFIPTRGIRQANPLAFFFTLCRGVIKYFDA